MQFNLEKSIEILERTPGVLKALLSGLSDEWIMQNEGPDTWSPFDVVGHMLHGENTDWMQRLHIILDENGNKKFVPFNRFAMFEESKGKSMSRLLDEFEAARLRNLKELKSLHLSEQDFDKTGIHPSFGLVTMRQLLSTYTTHDLGHIGQIVRVIAKQYKAEVGPWIEYMRVLQS
jgi:hypothetical protein